MKKGLFITGTDTEVGKTLVSCIIAQILKKRFNLAVMKPYACGNRKDAERLRQSAGLDALDLNLINPVYYQQPLSPFSAAGFKNDQAGWSKIFSSYRRLCDEYDFVLVEGIGGLHVPLTQTCSVADLAREMKLPILIVARAGLGTLNHTLLTVEYALQRKLDMLGIILNAQQANLDFSVKTNQKALSRLVSIPIWGSVPFLKGRFDEKVEKGVQLHFLQDHLKEI